MSRYFVQEVYGKRFSGVNPQGMITDNVLCILPTQWIKHIMAVSNIG